MAEDKKTPKHQDNDLTRDDVRALSYVLEHVRGSSPSSMLPLSIEDVEA